MEAGVGQVIVGVSGLTVRLTEAVAVLYRAVLLGVKVTVRMSVPAAGMVLRAGL